MLSVVIIAWNEEQTLDRAVSSVRQVADEIIVVVDEASTDGTMAIAKKLKCKVFTHQHTGIVEPMRNFAISKAKGPWVLLLDADEQVSAGLAAEIKRVQAEDKCDYVRIPRKNIIFGKWNKSDHWWPDYVYRLFKKGSLRWDDKIHSLPFTKGVGLDVKPTEDNAMIHHHYETVSDYVEQINRYTDFQAKYLEDQGYLFKWTDLMQKPVGEFLNQYFARRGYKLGIHGLALALLQAFSELVLYLKLWQSTDFLENEIRVTDLEKLLKVASKEFGWWKYEAAIRNGNILVGLWYKLLRKLGL